MDQLNIFEVLHPKFKIKNRTLLIEFFAGIGAQAKALKKAGVDFEHYKVVENDKYAIASYNATHGTNFEPSDITKIHAKDLKIVNTDLLTYLLTLFHVKLYQKLEKERECKREVVQQVDCFGK